MKSLIPLVRDSMAIIKTGWVMESALLQESQRFPLYLVVSMAGLAFLVQHILQAYAQSTALIIKSIFIRPA